MSPDLTIGPLRLKNPTFRLDGKPARGALTITPEDCGVRLAVHASPKTTHSLEITGAISPPRSVIAHGWHSWNGSEHRRLADARSHESHGMIALVNSRRTVALGLRDHRAVWGAFVVEGGKAPRLRIRLDLPAGDSAVTLGAFARPGAEEAERAWAAWVASAMGTTDKPRPIGWCSWYCNYAWFDGAQLEEYAEEMAPLRESLGLDVFLIDASYFAGIGDWLETHPHRFPKSLRHYARVLAGRGFTPGIWVAPFMVGDRSKLYREHPDWVCRDKAGAPLPMMRFRGEDSLWFHRDRHVYALDTSRPETMEYLRHVFRSLRSFGYRYFKTDFMFWGAQDDIRGVSIARHTPGKTRAEYFRATAETIRDAIGPDSFWSGCGSPLWTACGLLDSNRLTADTGPVWAHTDGFTLAATNVIRAFSLRNFVGPMLYHSDADCVMLRHWEHEWTDDEVVSMALLTGMGGGLFLTSDPLHECLPERRGLFRFCSRAAGPCGVQPVLKPDDPVITVVRPGDPAAVLVFNAGDKPVTTTVRFAELGFEGEWHVWVWREGPGSAGDRIALKLRPHQSALLFLRTNPFPKSYRPGSLRGENVGVRGEKALFG